MRSGTLRALIRELRAGGVSEYTETNKGRTVTIRLGSAPVQQQATTARKAPAKAAELSRRDIELLNDLGVTKDELDEVVARVS